MQKITILLDLFVQYEIIKNLTTLIHNHTCVGCSMEIITRNRKSRTTAITNNFPANGPHW